MIKQEEEAECDLVFPQSLQSFLSHSNCLESLDLSNSDCCLEQVHTPDTHLGDHHVYLFAVIYLKTLLVHVCSVFFLVVSFSGMFLLTERLFETSSRPQDVKNRLLSQVRLTCL